MNGVCCSSYRLIRLRRAPSVFPFRRKTKLTSQNNGTAMEIQDYEAAVATLNSLVSNASMLERSRQQKDRLAWQNIPKTQMYLNRLGVSLDDLDHKFKTIHIAGTKGKGSTSAFCESVLRCHSLKTGFYSSPHLVEVRERIRINGKPLSREAFARYFWHVFGRLTRHKEAEDDMPNYFKFLTVMAFYVFVEEKVDAAVVEVGIGGLYDDTNVIRNPTAVGITSLGLDHVSLLGDTVEKIAVHKAGIMKSGVPAFTVADQPGASMGVLAATASRVHCPLYVVPELEAYHWNGHVMELGLAGRVQLKNAALALQLSRTVLQHPVHPKSESKLERERRERRAGRPFDIGAADARGLALATWPGRSQTLHRHGLTFYIDGAHTAESIDACVQWFGAHSSADRRALIFNSTGDRNAARLLAPLHGCHFDLVVFCPNAVVTDTTPPDLLNLIGNKEQQLSRCQSNMNAWLGEAQSDHQLVATDVNINEALQRVHQFGASSNCKVDVLVTGSLHLVGGVLSLLDPKLTFLNADRPSGRTDIGL